MPRYSHPNLLEVLKSLVYNIDQTKEINLQTNNQKIRAQFMELASKRGLGKSFCPSEVARQVDPANWRNLMEATRKEGKDLVQENLLICTQKGNPADPALAIGPIRFGLSSAYAKKV